MSKGFENTPVRFFIWQEAPDADNPILQEEGDFMECDENDFLQAEGEIEYERHTVFANGVSQICLTKNPFSNC